MAQRRYKNPPIVEALCEFRFTQPSAWDTAAPDRILDRLKQTYPVRGRAKRTQVQVTLGSGKPDLSTEESEIHQFCSADRTALVQVGEAFLAIHRLSPYTSWHDFGSSIQQALQAYIDAAHPTMARQPHLRYINRMQFEARTIPIEDYFQFYAHLGPDLPQEHGPFIVGVQIAFEQSRDLLKLTMASAKPSKPAAVAVQLDIDYALVASPGLALDQVLNWTEVAHQRLEDVFEGCVTEKLRQQWEEE